jgi:hypothetical protein
MVFAETEFAFVIEPFTDLTALIEDVLMTAVEMDNA